jgi:ankyrin repeat protein
VTNTNCAHGSGTQPRSATRRAQLSSFSTVPTPAYSMPLQLAICGGHADVARLLIAHGANAEAAFCLKDLQCARNADRASFRALVRELLRAHADVSHLDVLLLAIKDSDAELVRETLEGGMAESANADDDLEELRGPIHEYIRVADKRPAEVLETARALYSHPTFDLAEKIEVAGCIARNHVEGVAWVRELCDDHAMQQHADVTLWAASAGGCDDIVKEALKRGADCNATFLFYDEIPAIRMASHAGERGRAVVELLSRCDGIDASEVLPIACESGSLTLVKELLARGADPNFRIEDDFPWTHAIRGGHVDILRELLETGMQPAVSVWTYDSWSFRAGFMTEEIASLLLSYYPRVESTTNDLCEAAARGDSLVVRLMLCAKLPGVGALDIAQSVRAYTDYVDCTALQAVFLTDDTRTGEGADHLGVVRLLCDAGADLEARLPNPVAVLTSYRRCEELGGGGHGSTPLLLAARTNSPAIVVELAKRGADVNARDDSGRTALFYAREQSLADVEHALLFHGATL